MKFDDFSFHKDLIANLKTSIGDGRIAHAQYFQGDDGSANLAMAIAYAQEIMSGGNTDMFGGIDDRVSRLSHPDLHIVFPVIQGKEKTSDHLLTEFKENYLSNPFMLRTQWLDVMGSLNKTPIISVSESEAVYKKLSLKSYEGGYKTLIVWQAEKMNEGCSNKMLKLIEEPPERTLILLVGSDFNAMIPTIKSRVQKVEIRPLKNLEIKELLITMGIDNQSVMDYAMESKGSVGRALHLSTLESDNEMLDSFRDLMRIAFQKNVPGAIKWVDEVAVRGKTFQMNLINFGVEIYRQANLMNFMPDRPIHVDEKSNFVKKFSPFIKPENVEKLMMTHQKVHYNLSRNGNPKLLLLDCAFKLMKYIKK